MILPWCVFSSLFWKTLFPLGREVTYLLLWCWIICTAAVYYVGMIGLLFVLVRFLGCIRAPTCSCDVGDLAKLFVPLSWPVSCLWRVVGTWRQDFVLWGYLPFLCCWRFCTVVCALAWLACRFLKTRLCFVRTPTCCWLSCWWWFRTAVCVFVIFVWVGAGPVLVISAPGPRAPCNIFNPTRYTRLGIKCSSGLNSYARMPDNQQLKPLWRTAYYPHYRFIILLPTYYQSVCNGVISVGSDICLLFHCCS